MIYFIEAEGLGRVKIGFSANTEGVAQRLRAIATGCPAKPVLLVTLPGSEAQERLLHSAFASFRVHNEWFHFSDPLRALVDALLGEPEHRRWEVALAAMAAEHGRFQEALSGAEAFAFKAAMLFRVGLGDVVQRDGAENVATRLNCDPTTVRNWVRGRCKAPFDKIAALTSNEPAVFSKLLRHLEESAPIRALLMPPSEAPTVDDRIERIERELAAIRREAA